jgi:hypothetical protein
MRHIWAAGDQLNASDLNGNFAFGGSGSDGALAISSGTTTIDLAGAATFIKNYSSISITGTGALAFINPASTGTRIILKCQGGCTITSSATRAIDIRSLGSSVGGNCPDILDASAHFGGTGVNGSGGGAGGAAGLQITSTPVFYSNTSTKVQMLRFMFVVPGSAGGTGGNGSGGGTGGAGGRGAGALIIESGGAYNVTGTIDLSGTAGSDGTVSSTAGGGGGGGPAGMYLAVYGALTADSGTYTVTGGAAGSGGAGAGSTGGGGGGGGGSTEAAGGGGVGASGNNGGNGEAGAAGIAVRMLNTVFA